MIIESLLKLRLRARAVHAACCARTPHDFGAPLLQCLARTDSFNCSCERLERPKPSLLRGFAATGCGVKTEAAAVSGSFDELASDALRDAAGFSALRGRNSATEPFFSGTTLAKCSGICRHRPLRTGAGLASATMSIDVFRAVVLSIVLTFAVGPNASLLCAVWCHPDAAPTGSCEHPNPTSTPTVTAKDGCPDVAAGTSASVREEVRRGVSASDGQHAVVVAPFQFVPPRTPPEFGRAPGQRPPLEARPLLLALRI